MTGLAVGHPSGGPNGPCPVNGDRGMIHLVSLSEFPESPLGGD